MGPARLSAPDAAFLSLESPDAPMHVGRAAVRAAHGDFAALVDEVLSDELSVRAAA